MRSPETIAHFLFGALLCVLVATVVGLYTVWDRLDAGLVLRVVLINQVVLVFCLSTAIWRAAVLWVRQGHGLSALPWKLRSLRDSPAGLAVIRWRRAIWYFWWAVVANMTVAFFSL